MCQGVAERQKTHCGLVAGVSREQHVLAVCHRWVSGWGTPLWCVSCPGRVCVNIIVENVQSESAEDCKDCNTFVVIL